MRARRRWVLGLALATAVSSVRLAAADVGADSPAVGAEAAGAVAPVEATEALLQRGIELRKGGDDRGALALFARAFALDGSARALAQMALAEQALGLWLEAHRHLEQALAQSADDWITEHRATLDAALAAITAQLGELEVSCNVSGAEVRVDGRVLGSTPFAGPIRMVAGASVIQISAPGHFDVARQVYVDAGQLSRVNVVLTPSGESASPEKATAPNAVAGASPGPASAADGPGSARDALFYTSIGLSALGASVGVAGYVMREVNVSDYNDDQLCEQRQGVSRSEECTAEAAAIRRGEVLMIAGFSAAGVFGLTALYFWLDRPAAHAVAHAGCSLGFGGVACRGEF